MIALAPEPSLQVQVGEAISIMAEHDFPDRWNGLIDVSFFWPVCETDPACADHLAPAQQLTTPLSPNDFVVNNALLQTAHSIFRRCDSVATAPREEDRS